MEDSEPCQRQHVRHAVGACLGALLGAAAGWLFAFAIDMLAERALLVTELSAAAGLVAGVFFVRRRKPTSS